jgi:signal transduction histidine kinase
LSATTHPTVEDLRRIDLFDDLDDSELARWAEVAVIHEVEPGTVISEANETPEGVVLLLEGTVQGVIVERGRIEPVTRQLAPTWMGAIPVITETPFGGRMVAVSAVRFALVPADEFVELAMSQRAVHRRVMRQVRPLAARIAAREQNRERLESLGTMAAGLAHELNNPASAARRAASDLADALDVLASTIGRFVEAGMEHDQAKELVALQREALACAAARTPLSALDAADAEDELRASLEELGIAGAWRLAEPLAAAGIGCDWLERVQQSAGPATEAAVGWVAASLAARSIAEELGESTARMSKLVGAIKAYAFMDRGELVNTDIHEGLETTLVVLGHKLKRTSIDITRQYDRSLPRVTLRGSELNQVWTNLLANAIEALGDSGMITISTALDGECIRVDIADDGPGIPAQIRDRIFDPFFTTKAVGQGTGLGLDTARRIVTERLAGSIDVESEPGRTVFSVWLPLEQPSQSGP